MDPGELLRRLSSKLRAEVGPAVADEYTRTQAFMASVILERLARQVSLAPAHAEAERADLDLLLPALEEALAGAPPPVAEALASARTAGTVDALGPLIEELYRWGIHADPSATRALDLVRPVLRADIDRRMEIAS